MTPTKADKKVGPIEAGISAAVTESADSLIKTITTEVDEATTSTEPPIEDVLTHDTELTEAAGLTDLREAITQLVSLRLGKTPTTPFMLKLGFLPKGTKSSKMTDGGEVDIVLKPFEVFETTKDTKAFNIVMLNERLGLSSTRVPLNSTEAVKRLIGPICYALTEMIYPPETNKRGARIIGTEQKRAYEALGFTKWYMPNGTLDAAHSAIAAKVTLPVDAFELPEAPKSDEERKTYKTTITNIKSKATYSLNCAKVLYDTERDGLAKLSEVLKEHGYTICIEELRASSVSKANAAAKAAKRSGELDRSKAAEEARAAKRAEDTEALAAFIASKSSK